MASLNNSSFNSDEEMNNTASPSSNLAADSSLSKDATNHEVLQHSKQVLPEMKTLVVPVVRMRSADQEKMKNPFHHNESFPFISPKLVTKKAARKPTTQFKRNTLEEEGYSYYGNKPDVSGIENLKATSRFKEFFLPVSVKVVDIKYKTVLTAP